VGGETSEEDRYIQALITELRNYLAQKEWNARRCVSIFLGGGTPSLFKPENIKKIIDEVYPYLIENSEITLEANPGTLQEILTFDRLKHFREIGINRISFGAQSFNSRKLSFLGRYHSPKDIELAVELARNAGFSNINLDCIFGIPEETKEELIEDLSKFLSMKTEHLSIYSLTIEKGTEFGKKSAAGHKLTVDDDTMGILLETVQEQLQLAGYEQYEVSNFSLKGFSCIHNQMYWRGADYLGIGAGAVSYCSNPSWGSNQYVRSINIPGPKEYIQKIELQHQARQQIDILDEEERLTEFFLLRLRTKDGFYLRDFESTLAKTISENFSALITQLVNQKLLVYENDQIKPTAKGLRFVDSITLECLKAIF